MIKILFFAQTRELIGESTITLDISTITVAELISLLSQRGDKWFYALSEKRPLCAVNKQLVDESHIVSNHDEVAFFPPVTGG